MPATGPCAPERTFVAVRAIVPVTQNPPNRDEPRFATPCATNSQFDLWRRPVMPSATTAESSDSIAPSRVKAIAAGSTATIRASEISGRAGSGRDEGIPPNRVPMVSTGRSIRVLATATTPIAISMPGHFGRHVRMPRMRAMVTSDKPDGSRGDAGARHPTGRRASPPVRPVRHPATSRGAG